jgi:hypothetical protein
MDELASAPRTDVVVADFGCADLEGSGRAERCVRNLPSGQLVEYPYLTTWVHDHLRLPLVAARWVFAGYLLLVCALVIRVRRNRSTPTVE